MGYGAEKIQNRKGGRTRTVGAQDGKGPAQRSTPAAPIKKLSSLRVVFKFIPPYKWLLLAGLLALLASSGLTLGIVRSLEWLIDGGMQDGSANVDSYFGTVFIAIGLLGLATFFRVFLLTLLGERVVADFRKAVHANLLQLSPSYFEVNRPSEIAPRICSISRR